ncbi:hypothetical protein [Saccharothrix hoggarensis]|uniref:Myo-inositol-1-phosphate synthase n=1 Tax=Saccharothrix hoggarensis TaxID=913853 RepID=A0ABW3QJ08_9PSEU
MTDEPTGLWLIGARGSAAMTVISGLLALRASLAPPAGCVTERPEFAGVAACLARPHRRRPRHRRHTVG